MASYLRLVVTARCSLACTYCHQEGDPLRGPVLDTAELIGLALAGVDNGVRKVKMLGGEPLLREDLPEVVRALRAEDSRLDISLITGGAVRLGRLQAVIDAGLSRANLSIHGWSRAAFQARTGKGELAWKWRQRTLEALLAWGRPLKLNFVWRGRDDDADLAALLADVAGLPVVVNVLDDLGNPELGHLDVIDAVLRARGAPALRWRDHDPHSLSTLRLRWADGLEVEVKDQELGQVAPWHACPSCPVRRRCREGIHALRLSHLGELGLCMDRPDLRLDLRSVFARGGRRAAAEAWATWVSSLELRRTA